MTMLELWKTRLRKHQGSQFKYLKLVFNDHFVIALIFLVGALAMGYANVLKLVAHTYWWGPIILGVLYLLVLSIGHLANLLEEADSTFLLPKESELFHYLMAARNYSLLLPLVIIILGSIVIFPFGMVMVGGFSLLNGILLAISLLILKDVALWFELQACYEVPETAQNILNRRAYFYPISFVLILLGLYLTPFIPLILALIWDLIQRHQITDFVLAGALKFQDVIALENSRQFKILKIYNLFTDVPSLHRNAKRRKYLDGLLKLVPTSHKETYLYLYARGFLRGTEYIGFYLRFVIIGTVILFFIKSLLLSFVLYLLFIYLSGFQLLPFYNQYDSIVFTRLYPVPQKSKLAAFQRLLLTLLGVQWLLMSIPICIVFGFKALSLLAVAAGIVFAGLFVFGYAKTRLTKVKS